MRRLTFEQLNEMSGGGWVEVVDGACAIFGAAALISKGAIVVHPAGGTVAVACTAWAIGRWLA